MAFDTECKFPGLIKARDPGVLSLRLTAQTLTEQLGNTFDPEAFGTCEYEDQAVTLAHLNECQLTVCRKHAKTMLRLSGKSLRPVSGGYSAAEMAGEFPGLRPWSHTPQQEGERSSTWRTAKLSAATINSLGGKQALRDGMFSLSYFTYGYHDNEGIRTACVYLPAIQAQLELPDDDSNGFLGWESRALLSSICGRRDYRDGLNDEGISLFEAEPVVSLADRIAEAARLVAADAPGGAYMTSPDRKAADLRSVWNAHKENITGVGAASQLGPVSPGKLPAGRCSILDAPRKSFFDPAELCENCGALNQRGDGTACSCGHVTGYTKSQATSRWEAPATSAVDQFAAARADHMSDFVNMLREGAEASQRHRGTSVMIGVDSKSRSASGVGVSRDNTTGSRNGARAGRGNGSPLGGGGGPPGDGGDDGDDHGSEDGTEDDAREAHILKMVRAALDIVSNSQELKKVIEEHALAQHQLAMTRDSELLEQQGRIAALAMAKQELLAGQIETRREAHQERMQKDAQQHSDEATERKKVAEQFPAGILKTVTWLRSPGHGDMQNQTGDHTNGRVFPVIGSGLASIGKLYLAMMAAACDPETQNAFGCDVTEAMCYSVLSLRLGGAPSSTGMRDGLSSCELEFNHGSALYDFRNKLYTRTQRHGVRSTIKEVPKVKNIKFIDNKSMSKEHFSDIYSLEAAVKNLGKIVAMVYGGALYAMFELCAQRLRELYEYDPHVYHLDLLQHLANKAFLEWTQRVFRLSEDEDYQLPAYQLRLSDHLGFDLPTPTPGDGFARDSPFMRDNYDLPMSEDVLTAVRRQLATVPDAVKAAQGFSGLPHVAHVQKPESATTLPAAAPAAPQTRLRLGASRYVTRDGDSSESEREEDESARLGDDEGEDDWVSVADLELATVLGSHELWDRLLGNSSKPIGIASVVRKGGTVIRLPRDFLREMYASFPKGKDPRTGAPVDICLRFLCHPPLGPDNKPCGKTACSTDTKHPLHRPGENQCNRYHPPFLDPGFLTDLQPGHIALGLVHGGLRCYPRPTTDPNGIQAEGVRLQAAQSNNASLGPVTWLGSEQASTEDDGEADELIGAPKTFPRAERGGEVMPDWGLSTPAQQADRILKVGLLRVPRLPGEYVVSDLGGVDAVCDRARASQGWQLLRREDLGGTLERTRISRGRLFACSQDRVRKNGCASGTATHER